jgi:hypothetical protein
MGRVGRGEEWGNGKIGEMGRVGRAKGEWMMDMKMRQSLEKRGDPFDPSLNPILPYFLPFAFRLSPFPPTPYSLLPTPFHPLD